MAQESSLRQTMRPTCILEAEAYPDQVVRGLLPLRFMSRNPQPTDFLGRGLVRRAPTFRRGTMKNLLRVFMVAVCVLCPCVLSPRTSVTMTTGDPTRATA